ncbi:MAG: hypothetical protein KDJ29_19575, partial [Hyphomicrobiales bacterium]|nr:hypothetical protein [Hyphomicrobiales bacterium]
GTAAGLMMPSIAVPPQIAWSHPGVQSIVRKSGYRFFAYNDALILRIDQLLCLQLKPLEGTLI